MTNYTTPYNDLEVLDSGHFRDKRGRILDFTVSDVKYIYSKIQDSDFELSDLFDLDYLSEHIIRRIITTINEGLFNDVIYNGVIVDDFEPDAKDYSINIYDGIHIEVHNHYESGKKSKKKHSNPSVRAWSKKVRERDNYTCQVCGAYNKQHSEAHHLVPLSKNSDLATDEGNGVCLCQRCHKEYHNKYNGSESPSTFFKFGMDKRRY
jgi:hypothetical protein